MQIVTLISNPLDFSSYERFEVEDVRAFLKSRFDVFPKNARIYHEHVATSCDVTPVDEATVERLKDFRGELFVVLFPREPLTIILVVVAVLAVAAAFLLKPKVAVPTPALRSNQRQSSPNNELSARTNRPRVNGRIPDIFGTIRSTPDLLTSPYKIFISHTEVEYAYMCIGRGAYDVSSVRDDATLVSQIAGTSVEVFAPLTSPNNIVGDPQLRIGVPITQPLYHTKRSNSIDGQVLRAPNSGKIIGQSDIKFVYPAGEIELHPDSDKDFTDFFEVGDTIEVTGPYTGGSEDTPSGSLHAWYDDENYIGYIVFDSGVKLPGLPGDTVVIPSTMFECYDNDVNLIGTFDFGGTYTLTDNYWSGSDSWALYNPIAANSQWQAAITAGWRYAIPARAYSSGGFTYSGAEADPFDYEGEYEIIAVDSHTITVADPELVNANWEDIVTETAYLSPTIVTVGEKWIGPFVLDFASMTTIFANFIALNGLYKDDGTNQYKFDINVVLEVTPVDANGTPTGSAVYFSATVEGSSETRDTRAVTLKAELPFTGRASVRARRTTDTDLAFSGSVIDEVKWRDVYAANLAPEEHFGNVTTVHAVTIATSGALSIKDRKLNMLVTRKLPQRVSGSTFTEELFPTNDAADIISFICLDVYIGNRSPSEIDFDNIYDTLDAIEAYFGIPEVREFSHTFDDINLSFEETIATIASAIFCTAYRRGNVIKLSFEKQTEDSTLLFNHRNKLPGTESRTVRFGKLKDSDGIEYEYVDPEDDSVVTFYLPLDQSAVNAEKIEGIGIRTHEQAHLHAYRLWNKLQYQNLSTQFTATREAELIVNQDRVLVADNTRPHTQDGYIKSQDGMIIELSQPVTLTDPEGHTIFIQHYDRTIQAIEITAGADDTHVVLTEAPTLPLALSPDLYTQPLYVIVGNTDGRPLAFLATDKEMDESFTFKLTAVNYDERYYQNDQDYAA